VSALRQFLNPWSTSGNVVAT